MAIGCGNPDNLAAIWWQLAVAIACGTSGKWCKGEKKEMASMMVRLTVVVGKIRQVVGKVAEGNMVIWQVECGKCGNSGKWYGRG